jgi:hypothetical protein
MTSIMESHHTSHDVTCVLTQPSYPVVQSTVQHHTLLLTSANSVRLRTAPLSSRDSGAACTTRVSLEITSAEPARGASPVNLGGGVTSGVRHWRCGEVLSGTSYGVSCRDEMLPEM